MFASTLFVLLLAPAPGESSGVAGDPAAEINESATHGVPAQPIEKPPPNFPYADLRRRKEAWVQVTYCIDEAGETQNVAILDSIGGPRFEQAAIEAVGEWQFEPATVDGEPSWQSHNAVFIAFALSDAEKGASQDFIRQYRKLHKLIDEKQLEEADALFRRLDYGDDLSLYELSKLWAQRVRIEALTGNLDRLDLALHRATALDGRWIDEESYTELLALHVQVEATIGKFGGAIEAFETLTEVAGEGSAEVQAVKPVIERIAELIDSDQALSVPARIGSKDACYGCNDSWRFSPVRRAFALSNVSGNLRSVDIRCDRKRVESKVSDDVEWNIPENWGSCSVTFYGDPGTTFDVVTLPPAT